MSKNIHDLSDDEFDDLFRESAGKSDIGFDPDAWKKMSQKLDAASAPPSSPGKGGNSLTKWGLPVVIVLLLLITGTYFLLRKPSDAITETKVKAKENSLKQTDKVGEKDVATDKVGTDNEANAKEIATSSDKVQGDKVASANIKEDTRKADESLNSPNVASDKQERAISSKIKQNKLGTKGESATETEIQGKTSQVKSGQKAAFASSDKRTEKSSDAITSVSEATTVIAKDKTESKSQLADVPEKKSGSANIVTKGNKQPPVFNANKAVDSQALLTKTNNSNSSKAVEEDLKTTVHNQNLTVDSVNTIEKMRWAPVHVLSSTKYAFDIDLKLPDVSFGSPLLAPIIQPGTNTAFRRGLNIRLALSPDFSFIPSNKVFKVGNNWAAILEYRFNNRWSIQTGVIRSLKLYNALPDQYEWNIYFPLQSPLKDVDATCKMLDIPLNIRYDLSQKPNYRWFVGAGFTSYIMLNEQYQYNYENPADPKIKRTNWEGKTGGYPFSVLNLSTGYERQLFRRLTVQAEPFYKAPLGKVGYGKVRLATAGVFFSVKYPF